MGRAGVEAGQRSGALPQCGWTGVQRAVTGGHTTGRGGEPESLVSLH